MDSLYISRVVIKNYRNFKDLDVNLQHKSVIVGENNIGKTNFIRALQLILDPSLSDEDRMLSESDFNDSLENPMENNQEILIQTYISNYRRNVAVSMNVFRKFLEIMTMIFRYRLWRWTQQGY